MSLGYVVVVVVVVVVDVVASRGAGVSPPQVLLDDVVRFLCTAGKLPVPTARVTRPASLHPGGRMPHKTRHDVWSCVLEILRCGFDILKCVCAFWISCLIEFV